jgi:hypothetical protein
LTLFFINNIIFYFIIIKGDLLKVRKLLGIGDWGLGIGDLGLGPIPKHPNPQPPTPSPN